MAGFGRAGFELWQLIADFKYYSFPTRWHAERIWATATDGLSANK